MSGVSQELAVTVTGSPEWRLDNPYNFLNIVSQAELAPAFASAAHLDRWLDLAVFQWLALSYAAGWIAAQAFVKYRRGGGAKTSPLPDFHVGAHAEIEQRTLITRDAARYRTYFPNVRLIAPS